MDGRVHFCPNDQGVYSSEADLCVDCGGPLIVDRRGELIEGWMIDHLIGLGGMRCTVWEGAREDGAVAAIKISETDSESSEARRLIHSASLVHHLEHPNIVRVYSYGETEEGEAHVVMELLRGRTLLNLLQQRGVITVAQSIHVVRQVLTALGFVHDRGLVHRDVKPGNVHLSPRGNEPWDVRLIDFGVAKVLAASAPNRIQLGHDSPGAWGRIVGTPEYMAPEQVLGAPVDGRADLYGAGIMLYRLVTGELPFTSPERQDIYEQQLRRPVPPPRAPEGLPPLSPRLTTALMTALAKQPADRFPSAQAFIAALDDDRRFQAPGGRQGLSSKAAPPCAR